MKKSLIALAALAAVGAASAQSSVTLYGVVDVGFNRVAGEGNGHIARQVGSGMNASSRLGVRGTEDLGGGLKANFVLEGTVQADSGVGFSSNTNNQPGGVNTDANGFRFNRTSYVGLSGNFGEVRLGRDYTPVFNAQVAFDPFTFVGSATVQNLLSGTAIGTTAGTAGLTTLPVLRLTNGYSYFTPKTLGGFYGHLAIGQGENASNAGATEKDGNTAGVRLGYAAGPLDVSVGSLTTKFSTGNYQTTALSAGYDFGFAKVTALANKEQVKSVANPSQKLIGLAATVPFGAGQFKVSYVRVNVENTENDADQIGLGYVYNLSKRTALYTTYGRVNNKGTGMGFNNGRATTVAGGNTSGLDLGIRHAF